MYSKFNIDFSELVIDIPTIERVLGYKTGEAEPEINEMIHDVIKELSEICYIRAEYRIFSNITFDKDVHVLGIEGNAFSINKIVFNQLKKSDSVALFLCTAGEAPGLKSQNAMKDGDMLKGYLYDLAGSGIAEAAAETVQAELAEYASLNGLLITNRYSPGYCGWDVAEQHKLFRLMPDNHCGIILSESALMKPVKSVSGIIGIGKNVKINPYTCNICNMKDCSYRKIKERSRT
jgi:hypothetical protein